jgi:hypothetical protein
VSGSLTRRSPGSISLQWSVPLISGGICMLIFPLWMFGMPGASDSPFAAGWRLGLNVLLYYPPAVAFLFFVSRLHRWTSRKAARPRIDLLYLAAAHVCWAAAIAVMAFAVIRILDS